VFYIVYLFMWIFFITMTYYERFIRNRMTLILTFHDILLIRKIVQCPINASVQIPLTCMYGRPLETWNIPSRITRRQ